MTGKGRIVLRVCIALGAGLTVSAIAVVVSWMEFGGFGLLQPGRMRTVGLLLQIDKALEAYRTETGSFPESLLQLRELKDEALLEAIPDLRDGDVLRDEWDRPLLYATDFLKCTVLSLGRDGRPGGRGPDCDMTNHEMGSPACYPTLIQFLLELDTGKMPQAWIACGALTVLISLVSLRGRDLTTEGAGRVALKLCVTTLGATFMAVFLSALEVPSGH